jgi:GntR family transcriptional regulator
MNDVKQNPKHDERLPLYQRMRDDLAEKIAMRQWRHGEAIPTEAELTTLYGVSPGTVRKAIDLLVADGLLDRMQGKGTFVRRPSFDSSLFRFFRFEGVSGERLIPESRILTRSVEAAPSAVARSLRLSPGAAVIRMSRLRLLEHEPFLAEEIWLPKSRFAALLNLDTSDFGDLLYPIYEERCGQVVASAEETMTAEPVNAAYAQLLRIQRGAPVVVIDRLAFSYDHLPLEWRRTRGRADKFRYRVEIR